jgi:hypothetical protein
MYILCSSDSWFRCTCPSTEAALVVAALLMGVLAGLPVALALGPLALEVVVVGPNRLLLTSEPS